jgi:6,7-dimethyl-8-ribityllumazine synthase
MSDFQLPPKPRVLSKRVRIAVVASRFNSAFSDSLVENTLSELLRLIPEAMVDLHQVPGAFEIPFAVEHLARLTPPDAIIALGVVIRGATAHADLVGESVTNALQDIAVRHLIPVIHEVLLVDDKDQARERCMGERHNRGREAARAAAMMLAAVEKLRKARPAPKSVAASVTGPKPVHTNGQETRSA